MAESLMILPPNDSIILAFSSRGHLNEIGVKNAKMHKIFYDIPRFSAAI